MTALSLVAGVASIAMPATARAQTAETRASQGALSAPTSPPATAPGAHATKLRPPTLVWRWPTFRTSEYVATGIFAGLAVGGLLIPTGKGRWTTVNAFDAAVRDSLRLEQEGGRKSADDASDLMLTLSLNHVLFDSLVVAWWGHGRGSVAYQMTLIDLETLAFSNAVTSLVKGIAARERPYSVTCRSDPHFSRVDDCDDDVRTRSFFSGHSSTAFTAAGLTCSHHAHLPLYGGGAGDALACITALGFAGATGALRITSDNHYASDVITGAAFGTLAGLGLPWLLHYREEAAPAEKTRPAPRSVSWTFVPGPMTASIVGEF